MIDYEATLYAAMYGAKGQTAVLQPNSTDDPITVTVIWETKGITQGDDPQNKTIAPLARVRVSELTANGMTEDDLDDGDLTYAGKTWRILSHRLRPSPGGPETGEYDLTLIDEGGVE